MFVSPTCIHLYKCVSYDVISLVRSGGGKSVCVCVLNELGDRWTNSVRHQAWNQQVPSGTIHSQCCQCKKQQPHTHTHLAEQSPINNSQLSTMHTDNKKRQPRGEGQRDSSMNISKLPKNSSVIGQHHGNGAVYLKPW